VTWSNVIYGGIFVVGLFFIVEVVWNIIKQYRLKKFKPYEFKPKPIPIQAVQVLDIDEEDGISLGGRGRGLPNGSPPWLTKAFDNRTIVVGNQCLVIYPNSPDETVVGIQDWLIYGIKGDLSACKPDLFDLSYD